MVLKMVITEFVLWKQNQNGKWIKYNGVFPFDPASIAYQRAIRLIRNSGWLAFNKTGVPSKHEPLDINADNADLTELEKLISSDDLSIRAGKAFSEFYHDYSRKDNIKKQAALKAKIEATEGIIEYEPLIIADAKNRALQQALEDYKNRKPIPHHLVNQVIQLCNSRSMLKV